VWVLGVFLKKEESGMKSKKRNEKQKE